MDYAVKPKDVSVRMTARSRLFEAAQKLRAKWDVDQIAAEKKRIGEEVAEMMEAIRNAKSDAPPEVQPQ